MEGRMRESTRRSYRDRMLSVLAFIEAGLDRSLTLAEIAAVADFSPYHFHRVFRGTVGESISGFIRRLRLERAAGRLLDGDEPVMVIALRAGYYSNQAFTRAFLASFGEPPSQFRRLRRSIPLIASPSGYHYHSGEGVVSFITVEGGAGVMDAKVVTTKDMKVLSVRHVGPYHMIGEAFERLDKAVKAAGVDTRDSQWLAIYNDDPDQVPAAELTSEACVTVGEFPSDPGGSGMKAFEIPGGLHATTRHVGSYDGLHASWGTLVGSWIPSNGFKPRCAPCYEIYVKGHECTSDESEFLTDLYEPVDRV